MNRHDPNEPYRQEAQLDAEAQVREGDRVRDRAREVFDESITHLEGQELADAKETMERDLDRKGVRR